MPAGRWAGFSVFGGRNSSRRNKKERSNNNNRNLANGSTSSSSGDSSSVMQSFAPQQPWTAEAVASLPPPGLSGPGQIVFSPSLYDTADAHSSSSSHNNKKKSKRYLAFVSSPSTAIRTARSPPALYKPLTTGLYPVPHNSNKQHHNNNNPIPPPPPTASSNPYAPNYSQPQYVANGLAVHNPSALDASVQPQQQQQQQPVVAPPLPPPQQPPQAPAPSSGHQQERVLMCMDLTDITQPLQAPQPMLRMARQSKRRQQQLDALSGTPGSSFSSNDAQLPPQEKMSLEERLRRERQRLTASSGSLTQFSWAWCERENEKDSDIVENFCLRVLIPTRGNLYIQDGVLEPLLPSQSSAKQKAGGGNESSNNHDKQSATTATTTTSLNAPRCIHDKSKHSPAVDAQFSPDGTMVAWTADGEIYVQSCNNNSNVSNDSSPATAKDNNNGSTPAAVPKPNLVGLAPPVRLTFGAVQTADTCIRHGVADFVAQEEIDRYRGFWWHPDSNGILLVRVDETAVPPFRILHHDAPFASASDNAADPYHRPLSSAIPYEDHRYPFAGKSNPKVQLAFLEVDRESILQNKPVSLERSTSDGSNDTDSMDLDDPSAHHPMSNVGNQPANIAARENWTKCVWFDSPREASEYLARIHWLPDGSVAAQWQNRAQNVSVITRMDLERRKIRTLLTERSETWINLHHNFKVLYNAIHPDDCIPTEKQIPPMPNPLPEGSFSFLYASERTGFQHLYLYTFVPGIHGDQAIPLRAVTSGEWMVENIVGVDMEKDAVYVTGTFDSALERHLYAVPLLNRRLVEQENAMEDETATNATNGVRRGLSKVMHALSGKGRNGRVQEAIWSSMRPVRLTIEPGMHSIVMDDDCEIFVDTSSDLDRPTASRIYELPGELWGSNTQLSLNLVYTLFDAIQEDNSLVNLVNSPMPLEGLPSGARLLSLPPPELISFPSSDGADTLHAAVYRPNPRIYGPGPYPLVCAVYGGPHVQRVNRSWSQCADMRAQRLRSLGFCVVKCDNRGSSRRGMAFESTIRGRLGKLEVLDQVAAVRHLTLRGIVDSTRVGVYGWSYGGYLAAMCLCRAPDVFRCAVSGAPVTSWDGYDTHYTERYMGHPNENGAGYKESAVFDHVPNMNGKIMIVHGLLDENVHFRHTARLINKLVASEKDYDLLLFPEERHSPRRLRDRIYMEQRISDFFLRELCSTQQSPVGVMAASAMNPAVHRPVGHL